MDGWMDGYVSHVRPFPRYQKEGKGSGGNGAADGGGLIGPVSSLSLMY